MAYDSIQGMLDDYERTGTPLAELIYLSQQEESGVSRETFNARMEKLWDTMLAVSEGYTGEEKSWSGLVGGDARRLTEGPMLCGELMTQVMVEALKQAESNACMRVIVAAPTAGSCGVLPAVLIPLYRQGADRHKILEALTVAAGVGQVIAKRASISGAEGGCQAEIGSASAMAAAAVVILQGGTPGQAAHGLAMALKSLLGLVCDPVAGLVEIPCVKRNVIGAVNALTSAQMALAGIESRIPADEVIDAMRRVGAIMAPSLRETGEGGLAATPTGRAAAKKLFG